MDLERYILDTRASNDEDLAIASYSLAEKLLLSSDTTEAVLYYLRQIYQFIFLTKKQRNIGDIWKNLVTALVSIVDSAKGEVLPPNTKGTPKGKHKLREKTLALLILKDLLPISDKPLGWYDECLVVALEETQSALLLEASLSFCRCFSEPVLTRCIINSAKSKSSRASCRTALTLLGTLVRRNDKVLNNQELFELSSRIAHALTSSQTTLTSATSKSGMVTRRPEQVTELDGTPLRDSFTVLNLSRHYSNEQILNICCFSLSKQWLTLTRRLGDIDADGMEDFLKGRPQFFLGSPMGRLIGNSQFFDNASSTDSDSASNASLSSSMSSLHSYLYVDDSSSAGLETSYRETESQTIFKPKPITLLQSSPLESSKMGQAARLTLSLDGACLKYCKRLLGQFERIPKQQGNLEVAKSSCIEAVDILTILCTENESNLQQIFPEIKRLNSRIASNPMQNREILASILQFFIANHDSVSYDIDESLIFYLQETASTLYHDSFACFEVIDFCLRNKSYFKLKPTILQKCYPSLLKMIAWHPRTFVKEFIQILPLFICKENASGLLNSLLDLPSLSLVLEYVRQKKLSENGNLNMNWSLGDQPDFLVSQQQCMFQFLLRKEPALEYPVTDIQQFHTAVSGQFSRARVAITCQIVPVLLEVFFSSLITCGLVDLESSVFTTLSDRLFKLLPVRQYQEESRKVLARKAKELCSCQPLFVSKHQEAIISVIHKARSGGTSSLEVLINFFDIVGRFGSRDVVCSQEEILRYYETLETIVYEVSNIFAGPVDIPSSGKSISILLSATAKLSACSQEFVPRTVLCLSKLTSNPFHRAVSPITEEEHTAILERSQELLGILRMPNVARSILCSHDQPKPWHVDKNTSVLLKVHAIARQTDVTNESIH